MTQNDFRHSAHRRVSRRTLLVGGASFAAGTAFASTVMARPGANPAYLSADPYASPVTTGPSSAAVNAVGHTLPVPGSPFLTPTARGWSCTSLLTTGNEVGGYPMAGSPDGVGAFENGDGTITILINHEIDAGHGAARQHGGKGAFVSRWVLDKSTLAFKSGSEFLSAPDKLFLWQNETWVAASASTGAALDIERLCSADLAPVSAFYNTATKTGYNGHIFLNGEEGEDRANRAFAWVAEDGTAYELPAFAFGKVGDQDDPPPCYENLLAHPGTGDKTLVIGNSDGGPSGIYVYLGTKRATGTPVEMAGLTDGHLFSLRVKGVDSEDRKKNIGIAKSRLGRGAGKRVYLAPPRNGTSFLRPEDGAWDPMRPNVYYFATTDQNNFAGGDPVKPGENPKQIGRSRLWAVTFDSVTNIKTDGSPTAKIEMLLDGTEGGDMFDNITVDRKGIVYLCEDTGEARHLGKIWAYDTQSGKFGTIMRLAADKFGDVVKATRPKPASYTPPFPPFIEDKETSGILDVTDLFANAPWFRPGSTALLVAVQAHFDYDTSVERGAYLYEGGQLLLLVKAA
jgi:hypothetical protein